jgi:hypothetical protein
MQGSFGKWLVFGSQKPTYTSRFRTIRLTSPTSVTMSANLSRFLLTLCALLCLGLVSCHKTQPHWVTLTWQATPNVPGVSVVGYNVYRSTTSAGPFVKLASRVPAPPYEDRLVNHGRTYFYVVTAVDQTGRESRFSTAVQATIP